MSTDLRQRLREAMSSALLEEIGAPPPNWHDSREIDRLIDAILPVLAPVKSPTRRRTDFVAEHDGIELGDRVRARIGLRNEGVVMKITPSARRPFQILSGWGDSEHLAKNEFDVISKEKL